MDPELKAYLDEVRAEARLGMADMKRDMADMKRDMTNLNVRVGDLELQIENDVIPKIEQVAEGVAGVGQQAERRLLEEVGAFGPRTVVSAAVVVDMLRRIQRLEEGRD